MSRECKEFVCFVLELLRIKDITYDVLKISCEIAMDLWRHYGEDKYWIIAEDLEEYISYNY